MVRGGAMNEEDKNIKLREELEKVKVEPVEFLKLSLAASAEFKKRKQEIDEILADVESIESI